MFIDGRTSHLRVASDTIAESGQQRDEAFGRNRFRPLLVVT